MSGRNDIALLGLVVIDRFLSLSSLYCFTESIFLYDNALVGALPDVGNLNLRSIRLQNNSLSGELPEGLWRNSQLLDLRLENNQFSGPLSPLVGNLEQLIDLRVNFNNLNGPLPAEIARLNKLSKNRFGWRVKFVVPVSHLLQIP